MEASIRLFKALPVESKQGKLDEALLKQTLSKGFLFAPEVVNHYTDTAHLIELVDKIYGRSGEQLNQSFHKSWAKVRDTPIEQLVLKQLLHYFTTYGLEQLGIYDQDAVYIPNEQLDVPELQDNIRLVIIKGYTKRELKAKLLDLLSSGVALHKKTIDDVLDVATFVTLSDEDIELVRNKEVKSALYEYLGMVPSNPTEFLRYVVYKATNKTLLIKNPALIATIKKRNNLDVVRYFDTYQQQFGLARLSEIFYRFKPLFLAFRTNHNLKQSINKIRRLAEKHHKPLPADTLNMVTAQLQDDQPILSDKFYQALENATIFRKIRLAYALKFRTTDADSILYRVRNGKSYATTFTFNKQESAQTAYEVVMQSLTADIAKNVGGKKIFIPTGIKYGLPATEKQFTGNLPSGTYVELAEDMVAGIHWENVPRHRIDLDLSLMSPEVGKIGWDASYRNNNKNILFSGDVTDAPKPHGASELLYIGQQARSTFILFVNYFNFNPNLEVPFKIVVAHQQPVNPTTHYTVDPSNIVALSNTTITVKQKNLGIIVADDTSSRFYFAESDLGNSHSAHNAAYVEHTRKYLLQFYSNSIILNDVLTAAGAEMVNSAPEADIDLSPETITKTTILDLLTPNPTSPSALINEAKN